jgi:Protein of unknown function (DUF3592)
MRYGTIGKAGTTGAEPAQSRARLGKADVALLALGAVLLVCAAVWASVSMSSTRGMIRTQGAVVSFLNDRGDLRFYRPVFAFVTGSGERVQVAGRTASTPPAYELGEQIALYYRPDRPSLDVVIDDFGERWFPVSILAGLGIAFAAAGAIARVCTRVFARADRGHDARVPQALGHVAHKRHALRRRDLMICSVPIAMGAIALAISCALFMHEHHLSSTFVRTTGQVVGMQARSRRFSSTHLYSAVVRFTAANGQPVTFVQGSASSGNTLGSGDTVGVLYDPASPQRARIDSFKDRWGASLILGAIGLPLLAIGVWLAFGLLDPFGVKAARRKRATERS